MARPKHLFVSDTDGALHDTRVEGWSKTPLRANFSRHHVEIKTCADLKATLRAGDYTSLGGYPLYFICDDGEALSFDAVRGNLKECLEALIMCAPGTFGHDRRSGIDRQWLVTGCAVNYEDFDLECAHTGEPIQAAYQCDAEG